MRQRRLRIWSRVHTWTSLICTVFLLVLCLTGLPLIFHREIDGWLGNAPVAPGISGAGPADLDRVVDAARSYGAGQVVQFVSWDDDTPGVVYVAMAPTPDSPLTALRPLVVDAATAAIITAPDSRLHFTTLMFRLHVDLFAGLPGKLFLGLMGLLFLAAIVSGVVLYAPFMRRQAFGAIRTRSRRIRWLDLHNFIGMVTITWAVVVGATGAINTCADLIIDLWRHNELTEMVAPYRNQPPVDHPTSLQAAVDEARAAAPGMTPSFVAFPRSAYSSAHHYAVFLRGVSPLTSRLVKPALIDAQTGRLAAISDLPWYGKALFVSQPLHFGDYGGLPLKIIWALLDAATIVVLGSGIYLWMARRRTGRELKG